MALSRSAVIDSELMMTSYFFACRPGIMLSQTCSTNTHLRLICSHRARAMSTSKPVGLPSGVLKVKGS